jgi:hypothetical protein
MGGVDKASRIQNLCLILAGILVVGAVYLAVVGFGLYGLVLLGLALVLSARHLKIIRR